MKKLALFLVLSIPMTTFAQQQCNTNCVYGNCTTTCTPTGVTNPMDSAQKGYDLGNQIGNSIRQSREAQQRADQIQQQQQQQNQAQQANAEAGKQATKNLMDKLTALCADPINQPYYAKTACKASDITFDQLLDKTKITPVEKAVLKDLYPKTQSLSSEAALNLRTYYGASGAKMADVAEGKFRPESDKNNLDLYSGKITWGEYNTKRKEIYTSYANDIRAISASK